MPTYTLANYKNQIVAGYYRVTKKWTDFVLVAAQRVTSALVTPNLRDSRVEWPCLTRKNMGAARLAVPRSELAADIPGGATLRPLRSAVSQAEGFQIPVAS